MTVTLEWSNEQDQVELKPEWTSRLDELLKIAARMEGVAGGEVTLTFVDDEEIRRLNREFRGIDKATDVLSFAMNESVEDEPEIVYGDEEDYEYDGAEEAEGGRAELVEPLGDIVISVPRAIAQAEEYGHSVEREIGFLFVHGFLHLLGYDHGDEQSEREMFAKQEAVLVQAGLARN